MEFKLISPLNPSGFTQIEFNFLELKTELTNSLEKYKNLVYTDEQIKEAKTDRAKLNKFKEALEAKRIEIKKIHEKPYNDFADKVKELVALIDEPINKIDEQVKKVEDKKAHKKKEELETYFNEVTNVFLKQIVSFEKIFNPKWLNTTYTIKKAKEEIKEAIFKFENELSLIRGYNFPQEMELQIINKYLENLSLSEALEEKTKLEALKSNLTTLENKTNETIKEDAKPVLNENADTYKVVFEVEATKEQLQMIKGFLQDNKITYKGNEDSEKLKKTTELLASIENIADDYNRTNKTHQYYRDGFEQILDIIQNSNKFLIENNIKYGSVK